LVLSIEHPLVGYEDTLELLDGKAIHLLPWGCDGPEERRPGWTYLKALMVVTGMDLPTSAADLEAFEELLAHPWPKVAVSGLSGDGFDALGRHTFQALDLVRVFSKEPGKDPDMERPFTLPRGATVSDLAETIHKEIAHEFRYARVWGPSAHDGQSVRGGHVLLEGDVVEIHR